MSHEIRTPMNGVICMIELLLDTAILGSERDYAETALGSAEALLSLINDILDFSKIEAGRLDLEQVPFRLDQLCDNVLSMFSQKADSDGIGLAWWASPEVPLHLLGDPTRLRQIMTNLISNALKFTKEGEVWLRIDLVRQQGSKAQLRFSVTDTGIGIPKEVQDTLFDAFTQADSSTTRCFGGTGLGLSICRQLTEMMGGKISIDSRPGEGSTFHFTINFGTLAMPKLEASNMLQEKRCLVVCSRHGMGQSVVRILRSLNPAKVSICNNGDQGQKLLVQSEASGEPIDLVVVDQNLCDGEGLEFLFTLEQSALQEKPAVILTHGRHQTEKVECASRGLGKICLLRPPTQPSVLRALQESGRFSLRSDGNTSAQGVVGSDGTASSPEPDPSSVKILAAEDNAVNRKLAMAVLSKFGFQSTCVENGQEAFDALEAGGHDLVLMDCQMPIMDGYTVTRLWREREQQRGAGRLPIIAMTAHAMAGDREKVLEAGMDDYVTKPIDRAKLYAAIQSGLSKAP
jgi:CheY-like chemotaxis protein